MSLIEDQTQRCVTGKLDLTGRTSNMPPANEESAVSQRLKSAANALASKARGYKTAHVDSVESAIFAALSKYYSSVCFAAPEIQYIHVARLHHQLTETLPSLNAAQINHLVLQIEQANSGLCVHRKLTTTTTTTNTDTNKR
jgi:hypothetical protein